jgi:hypothetical protein
MQILIILIPIALVLCIPLVMRIQQKRVEAEIQERKRINRTSAFAAKFGISEGNMKSNVKELRPGVQCPSPPKGVGDVKRSLRRTK